jgi:hypothetical protein
LPPDESKTTIIPASAAGRKAFAISRQEFTLASFVARLRDCHHFAREARVSAMKVFILRSMTRTAMPSAKLAS